MASTERLPDSAITMAVTEGLEDLLGALRIASVSAQGEGLGESADYLRHLLQRDGWSAEVVETARSASSARSHPSPQAGACSLLLAASRWERRSWCWEVYSRVPRYSSSEARTGSSIERLSSGRWAESSTAAAQSRGGPWRRPAGGGYEVVVNSIGHATWRSSIGRWRWGAGCAYAAPPVATGRTSVSAISTSRTAGSLGAERRSDFAVALRW